MAIDLGAIASATTAATALTNLVLVSPQSVVGYQPQNPTNQDSGIGQITSQQKKPSLLFHYEGEQSVNLESDITDHYVENNSAVQDQIALKPVTITTHGYIGELNDVAPYGLQTLKAAADKLTVIGAYAPQLSITAQNAYNEAFLAYQLLANAGNAAVSAWSSVSNLVSGSDGQSVVGPDGSLTTASSQNKQQVMFQQFYGYWQQRTLFTVQTPWAVFQNMAIFKLRAVQDESTNVITDFDVTFKMIRTAQTADSVASTASFAGRAATQASGLVNQGTSSGTPSIGVADGIAKTVAP